MSKNSSHAFIVKVEKTLVNSAGKTEHYTEVVARCTDLHDAQKVADDYEKAFIEEAGDEPRGKPNHN